MLKCYHLVNTIERGHAMEILLLLLWWLLGPYKRKGKQPKKYVVTDGERELLMRAHQEHQRRQRLGEPMVPPPYR